MEFHDYDENLDKIEENAEKIVRHTLPGNHHIHLNNAEFVAEVVLDFLRS